VLVKDIFSQKRNRIAVVMVCIVLLILVILFSLVSKILDALDALSYPESTLSDTAEEFKEPYQEEMLPLTISCPSFDYRIQLPADIRDVDGKIVGRFEGMQFVVCESEEDMDEMINKTLPNALNVSVAGFDKKVEVRVRDNGYFYPYPAEYVAMRVETKVTVREKVTYAFAYALELEPDSFLYIYVSTESEELLTGAKNLLDEIAYSVRPLEEEKQEGEILESEDSKQDKAETMEDILASLPGQWVDAEDYVAPDGAIKDTLYIDLEQEVSFPVENGVFLFEWMNVDIHPTEVNIYAPTGKELRLMEEYSSEGHYVYKIGEMESGTYTIKGSTLARLTGVVMSVYEWDYYYEEFVTFGFD